ncbi:positive control sigma-like factor [compost metagenome]
MNTVDDLLKEYRENRSRLMGYKLIAPEEEQDLISGMLSDLQYAIDWMSKGHHPQPRRGIYRRSRAQRTIPVDPLKMQSYMQPAACGSPTTLSDHERYQIEDALSTLTEKERDCYTMKYGKGYSIGDIAQMLNVKRVTIQGILKSAEKKVKENIENSLFLVC